MISLKRQKWWLSVNNCPCKNIDCERNTVCEECKKFHHANGGLTRCERDKQYQNEL